MNGTTIKQPESVEEVWATLALHFYHGLGANVIPSFRAVTLSWEPGESLAYLRFYHNTEVNEFFSFHNNCIEVDATSTDLPTYNGIWIHFEVETYFLPPSKEIPKADKILFAFEGEGIKPQNVTPFWCPKWHIQANFLLKFNEASVGRLTRSLRVAGVNWEPEKNLATIKFYHIGELPESVTNNYKEIYNQLRSFPFLHNGSPLNFEIEINSISETEPSPKEGLTRYLYWRAEPFQDPTE